MMLTLCLCRTSVTLMSGRDRVTLALLAATVLILVPGRSALGREAGASARALGLADAVQGLGFGTAGLYFNPAAMSQIRQYAIDAGYGYDATRGTHNAHVSVVDSQTNPDVGGGLGYTYFRSNREGHSFQGHDVRASLSARFGLESVSLAFGAGFRYLKVSGDLTQDKVSAPTLDLGALLGISDHFYLGVAGQNLITFSATHAPRLLGVGIGVSVSVVNIGGSAVVDFESKDHTIVSPSGGLEVVLANALALRSGFMWDRAMDQKRVTGGLGYISQYVGVDVGYGHDVSDRTRWVIQSSLRVFLP